MRERILRIFVAETVPAWVTIMFLGAGVLGTYLVTPLINQRQSAGMIRTDFTIKALDGLSERTRNLLAITSLVHQRLTHGKTIPIEQFDEAYRTIASLQWDVISLSIIFADRDTRFLIGEYQQALIKAQLSFQELEASVPADAAGIDATVKKDGAISGDILMLTLRLSMRIAQLAGVKTEQPDLQAAESATHE